MAEAASMSTPNEPWNRETASSSTTVKVQDEDGCTMIEQHRRLSYKQWKYKKRKERVSHSMFCVTLQVCDVNTMSNF